jgi:hypothetical protein
MYGNNSFTIDVMSGSNLSITQEEEEEEEVQQQQLA